MDQQLEGGVEGEDLDGTIELEQQMRLARGTLEQAPISVEDAWPVGALAWANTLDIEACSGAVFIIDDAGEVLAVNSRVEALVGRSRELVGSAIVKLLRSDFDIARPYEAPRGVRFIGPSAGVVAIHRDGTRIPIEVELIALDPRTVMVIARALACPSVVEQIDIAEIVHDLKTPLSVISLEAQLAADRARSSQVPFLQLERIERNVAYMDRLIHELLDLCSVDGDELRLDKRSVELMTLLDRVIDRSVASRDRDRVLLEAQPLVIDCDDRRIERVIANLVDNALTHTHAPVLVRVTESSQSVCVAVIDAGPGIPHEEVKQLFERYRRGSTNRPGTGLGLYVSRKIVESHGGRIGVESVRGVGSRFFIELPKHARCAPLVLIVDDDANHSSPLAEILRMEGYDVETATSASEAIAAIHDEHPDALVLDALLRRSRALDVLEWLREAEIEIPTAIVSGLPDCDPRIVGAVRDHGCTYVEKPISLPYFLRLLESFTSSDTGKFPRG